MAQYATINLDVYTDADYMQAFRQQNGAPGTYYDFTGCTLHMMVRKLPENVEVFLYLKSNTSGIAPDDSGIWIYHPSDVVPAGLYEFTIKIVRTDLQQIPEGLYEQSLIVERPDGVFMDIWRGSFTNSAGPTR
jgi:hypothetical protein